MKRINDGLTKHERYRLKDLDAYRKRKREYARTPEEREKRRLYQEKWRHANREKHNAWSRAWAKNHPDQHARNQRRAHLKFKYRLTPEDYERMLSAQSGGCALCGKQPMKRRLHIDHDHATGKVRGLLCARCNGLLGLVDKVGVERISKYQTGVVW